LRYVLLAGLVSRLVLAPLTSWGIDTPYFVASVARMLETGSPYGGNTFFNPPLGPVVELPFLAFASLFGAPGSWIQFSPGLMPVAIRTGLVLPYLPNPGAVLALKAPLLLSDTAVALLLYHAVRLRSGDRAGTVAAAAWFLNPLVIWASAVHGEVDTLAALCVLAAVLALERRMAFAAGILLGLGGFAKLYPFLLVPLAVAFLALDAARGAGLRPRLAPVARFLGGVGLSAVPFLPLLSGFSVVLAHQAGNNEYGGLSVFVLLNPNIVPVPLHWPGGWTNLPEFVGVGALAVAVVGGVAVLLYRFHRGKIAVGDPVWLALLALWVVVGSLLYVISVQAENVVGVLPLLLLALPVLGRWGRGLYWSASVSAWAQYLSLLGPLAYFYPLIVRLGPRALGWANGYVIPYSVDRTAVTQAELWTLVGVVGGIVLLALWVGPGVAVLLARLRPPTPIAPAARRVDSPAAERGARGPWRVDRAPRSARVATVFAVLIVAAMTAETAGTAVVLGPPHRVLTVAEVGYQRSPAGDSLALRLTTGLSAVHVHAGLLSGRERPTGPVYLFADAAFPTNNSSYTALREIAERAGLALTAAGLSNPIAIVNASELVAAVAGPPVGMIVILGGVAPAAILTGSHPELAAWLSSGGTLVWAGGVLGGESGTASTNGFGWSSPGWSGQLELAVYPVTDVGAPGALLGSSVSPFGRALGIEYNGTSAGANTTALAAHGGTDLGIDSDPSSNGASPRTSLAYLPLGMGGVFLFGGGLTRPAAVTTEVPGATLTLANDLAVIVGTGYVPGPGGATSEELDLGSLATQTVTLTLPPSGASPPEVAVVTTPTFPTFLTLWTSGDLAAG